MRAQHVAQILSVVSFTSSQLKTFPRGLSHGTDSSVSDSSEALSEGLPCHTPLDKVLCYSYLIDKATALEQMGYGVSCDGTVRLRLYTIFRIKYSSTTHTLTKYAFSTHTLIDYTINWVLLD